MTDELFADRYRLERRLGAGGMSTVELAFDTRLERYVAVKLLAEHLAQDSNFVARFEREARAAGRLHHPNIVQVFDAGLDKPTERQYIVMEYIDGRSCAEILRDEGHLEVDEAVDVLAQACRGLDYAHRNGVVHRDVKPGNLLRSTDGVVKLADFGIAKAAEQSDITKVGSVVGTAAYLSPEQARGEPAGPESDLYALGVVAYQLLAGRLPYEAASLTDLARQQDTGPPQSLDRLNRDVPPALGAAIMRALEHDPEARYADARGMEQALREGLRGVAPAPATASTRALRREDQTATRMLEGTAATTALPHTESRPRRRLEPLDEPPPPRRPVGGPPPRRAAAARPAKKKRSGLRRFLALVALVAVVAVGLAIYQATSSGQQKVVKLNQQIRGDVNQTIDSIKQLIQDNTR
jgi:eukaryotic-like serine/threonine-protein kinase